MKKIIWGVVITLFSLAILFAGAIAYLLNFVFTPEKLTPLVERVANENINGRVSLKSVELTFFSTFPNFSLAIDNGALMGRERDTTLVTDTIVSFDRLDVVVNPIALIKNNEIIVHAIKLERPHIYAAITPSGKTNWDVLKVDSTSAQNEAISSKASGELKINLDGISINNGTLIFDDRQSHLYTVTKNVDMNLSGDLSAAMADMTLALSLKDGLLWQNGELIFSRINLVTNASLAIDMVSKKLVVNQSGLELNSIKFDIDGSITSDTVDMRLSLAVPSLATVLELLPLKKEAAKLSSTGSVTCSGTVRGAYKDGAVPVIDISLDIVGATARYKGFEYGVDGLDIKANAHLDMSRRTGSYINLERFKLSGASTSVDFRGRLSHLLTNPTLQFTTVSKLNLTELAATFPLEEGVEMGGQFTLSGDGECSAAQLRKGDYATIKAAVRVDMQNVKFVVPGTVDSHFAGFNMHASNTSDGLLSVECGADKLQFNTPQISSSLSDIRINASGVKNAKDSLASFLQGDMNYSELQGSMYGDSVTLASGKSSVKFELSRMAQLTVTTDSLAMRANENRFNMNGAIVALSVTDTTLKAIVSFKDVGLTSPHFPLPMSVAATTVTINQQDITLRKAAMRLGSSDVTLTGTVRDLVSASRGLKPLTMKVDVNSARLNLTEIIHTLNSLNRDTTSIPDMAVAPDTSQISLPIVPGDIDFELNTQLAKVELGRLNISNMNGKVTLKDGVARLNNLSLHTLGAELSTTVIYDCKSDTVARVGLILGSNSIDVHSVIELMPALDTLMPMLNSFEGKIDFLVRANTKFHKGFAINPRDIRATGAFSGEDLVLLDGQTFAEISKMLMFKNKKRNVVDSVSVQMAVNNGSVEIFPFLIQMDRYRAAIGGEHFLDNHFDYHISVLKSPIPFKMGINITGSLDKMKVRIGKTKYKFMNEPSYVRQLNPKYIELGKEITNSIRKL